MLLRALSSGSLGGLAEQADVKVVDNHVPRVQGQWYGLDAVFSPTNE